MAIQLAIFLLSERKRQHAHDKTKSHKKCLFLVLQFIEGEGKLEIEVWNEFDLGENSSVGANSLRGETGIIA